MIFKYRKFYLVNPKKSKESISVIRPVIAIRFRTAKGIYTYDALIDSGADYCLFHTSLGKKLGLNVESGNKVTFSGTSGQKQVAYYHKVEFEVGNRKLSSTVGFSSEIDKLDFGLLGQKGFFDKFNISFNFKREEIEII